MNIVPFVSKTVAPVALTTALVEHQDPIEMIAKKCNLDWSVAPSPCFYRTPVAEEGFAIFPSKRFLVRSDTQQPISIVGNRYQPVQPIDLLESFRSVIDVGGFKFHSAGSFCGGNKIWALADTGRFGEVAQDDGIGCYLLLSTSYDGSLATSARFTSIRVTCQNTLNVALANNSNAVRFSHASVFDPALMAYKLEEGVSQFGDFMSLARRLQSLRLNSTDAVKLIQRVAKVPEGAKSNRVADKITELFEHSSLGNDLVGHTRWGLLNAVTEYVDHHRGRTQDARMDYAWFGDGNRIKSQAFEMLLAA